MLSFLYYDLYVNFQWNELKCLSHLQPFQGDSFLLTAKSQGITSTLLIDLTMKSPNDFEPVNPGLVFGKQLFNYSFILTKQCIKDLKYKLNRINTTYLHPIRTSDYSNSLFIMSCNGMLTYPPPSNKNSPHSKLKQPSRKNVSINPP